MNNFNILLQKRVGQPTLYFIVNNKITAIKDKNINI